MDNLNTAVIIKVLQSCGVSIDKVEMVLQPTHLRGVPGLPQLPQSGYLVHQLPLLRDPESSEGRKLLFWKTKAFLFLSVFNLTFI